MSAKVRHPAVRCFRLSEQPSARLVCLPHAGGSASCYRDWGKALPDHLDLLAVQYPGREERYPEPFADSLEALADEITEALTLFAEVPLVLFGHSLGAALAYEVALRLRRRNLSLKRLVVSAHPAPHRQRESALHQQGDTALLDDIRRLSGGSTPLDEPAMRELFMPMLRNDYRLIERYRRDFPDEIDVPVDVCFPVDDDEISGDEVRAWQDVTPWTLGVLPFRGGHFYLREQYRDVVDRVLKQLDSPIGQGDREHVTS
ncbi:pyochelin biosynthetic protein PchC [Alcanivorax xiamenensis]|uniref:Pyochelin biosynthetic protein PchC n=1 Tax=Alcanivorax xiamenensis TaxID=1177156 RepID=A0ABQ6YD39_9GAMM|nr:alpha/beta fold hydrolase [Alcanivorax xiamenensis]KAF0808146.1 pyochelin biosynthetic protein PchC [Alcanivorax xiamenensis]